jgi:hypothetical protein
LLQPLGVTAITFNDAAERVRPEALSQGPQLLRLAGACQQEKNRQAIS